MKPLSSYRYPGLEAIKAVMQALPSNWTNVKKLVRITGLSEWKVRSSLAFLVTVGMVERKKRGRISFYRLVREWDLKSAFVESETFFWILWSLLVRIPIKRRSWVEYALKLAQEMGIAQLGGEFLSEEGRREVLAAAIKKAYREVSNQGKPVPLSKIADVLEEWGLSREEFKKLVLGAMSQLGSAKIRRTGESSKAGADYLDLHYIVLE